MNHFISIVQALDLTTPALLFSALSLLFLAYTNRFLSYASVMRNLKDTYNNEPSLRHKYREQIKNLRLRVQLIRWMQTCGASSLATSVISMFFIYIGWSLIAHILFGVSMLMLFSSLVISIWEIQLSGRALDLHIEDILDDKSESDVLARDAQDKWDQMYGRRVKKSNRKTKHHTPHEHEGIVVNFSPFGQGLSRIVASGIRIIQEKISNLTTKAITPKSEPSPTAQSRRKPPVTPQKEIPTTPTEKNETKSRNHRVRSSGKSSTDREARIQQSQEHATVENQDSQQLQPTALSAIPKQDNKGRSKVEAPKQEVIALVQEVDKPVATGNAQERVGRRVRSLRKGLRPAPASTDTLADIYQEVLPQSSSLDSSMIEEEQTLIFGLDVEQVSIATDVGQYKRRVRFRRSDLPNSIVESNEVSEETPTVQPCEELQPVIEEFNESISEESNSEPRLSEAFTPLVDDLKGELLKILTK